LRQEERTRQRHDIIWAWVSENPILIDIGCEEGDTESELGSAQHRIFIEDALPQSDNTELKSDSGPSAVITPSAEDEPGLRCGLKAQTLQQNRGYFHAGSPPAHPPKGRWRPR